MEEKSQKPYLTDYNLLIMQDLLQAILKIKCIYEHDNEKCETCGIKYNCFLQYANFEEDLIEYRCLCCNKTYNFYNFYI